MSADTFNILGLWFGFAAGWALVYPVLWGYSKRNRLQYVDIKLENEKRDLRHLEAMTDQLPASLYSVAQKDAIKDEYRQQAAPGLAALQAEKAKLGEGHEWLSFLLSALGMFLLTAGFAAQLYAAMQPTPEVLPPPVAGPPQVRTQRHLLPAFVAGSATEPRAGLRDAVCALRQTLAPLGSRAAIVVGHYDWRALRPAVRAEFRDNPGLAQRRADRIGELLTDAALCPAPPLEEVTAVVGGPRNGALEDDRAAEVYAVLASVAAP